MAIDKKSSEKISVYQIRKHICEHSNVDLKILNESLLVKKRPDPELVALQKQIKLERRADVEEFLDSVAAISVDDVLSAHNIPTKKPETFEELQAMVASGAFSLHRNVLGITLSAIDRHIADKGVPAPVGLIKAAQMSQEMLDRVTGLSAGVSLDSAIRTVTSAGFTVTGGDGAVIDSDQNSPLGGSDT